MASRGTSWASASSQGTYPWAYPMPTVNGGGFYDRTLAALKPRPFTVGIGYAHGYVPWLEAEPHDMPLDAMITEDGVFWERD